MEQSSFFEYPGFSFNESEYGDTSNDTSHADPSCSYQLTQQTRLAPDGSSNASSKKKPHHSSNTDSNNQSDQESGDELEEKQFRFQAAVNEKNFKGQKSFEKRGILKIQDDSTDGVLRKVWAFCKQFVSKAVEFKNSELVVSKARPEATWSEEEPSFETMDQFIVFHDKSGKRSIIPSNVTSVVLQGWLAKTITITVYKFSDSVSSAQKYNAVESQLLMPVQKDRAGAESIASLDHLKVALKSKHAHRLTADDINWSCWANYISTKPMIEREGLMNQLPPRHLIGLFRTAPIHSDTILQKTKLDLRIAENENKAYRRLVCQMKEDHVNLVKIVEVMGSRISEMENQLNQHGNMLSAMKNTVAVSEDEYSASIASQVPDCPDVDHQ